MRLNRSTWPQVQGYFEKSDLVLLAVGSAESHGRHMPLGTDTLIPDRLLELIEPQSEALIAPTIPYGATETLAGFPGTVDIGSELLYQVLERVTGSLYAHGARRFAILNGHGGNTKSIERVGLALARRGALTAVLNWWLMVWDMDPAWKGGHGGAEETAGVLAIDPALVDRSQIDADAALYDVSPRLKATGFSSVEYKGVSVNIPRPAASVTPNGWIGPDHPSKAAEAWGKEMLQACANYIAEFLREFAAVDIAEALRSQIG